MTNREHTEGWVPLVNATVSVIDSEGVTHTTKTNSDGKYWLTDVAPGKYYVITACCACEDMEGVYKDVVEGELKEGETYDAGIADCESTALGLIVDFLLSNEVFVDENCNCYCNCFDEDSQIYGSLVTVGTKLRALAINLQSIPEKPLEEIKANADFQGFVVKLCELLEDCCIEPGVAPAPPGPPPPPPPPPGECDNNIAPSISSVERDGEEVFVHDELDLVVGKLYEFCVYATDPDNKLPQDLTYSLTITKDGTTITIPMGTIYCYEWKFYIEDVGVHKVYVNVSDGCDPTIWGPITVVVHDECYNNTTSPVFTTFPSDMTIDPNPTIPYSWIVKAEDVDGILGTLTFSLISIDPTPKNELSVDPTNGTITWNPTCEDVNISTTYEITVGVSDGCSTTTGSFTITLTTEGCECILSTLTILTNHNTFFGDYYRTGYPISLNDFTEGPSHTFVFDGEGINNALILLNKDNNLKFIPETENCYGVEISYQWKNHGCNNEILEPIPPGIAQNGEICPTKEYVPSKHFTICNPPAYNTLYIYLGEDTYIVNVAREMK